MVEVLLAIAFAWPLISYVAGRRRYLRTLPPEPKFDEWHRGPTWLCCAAAGAPFVTLTSGQVLSIVVISLAAIGLAWLLGFDEGLFRGREQGRGVEREANERRWQELTEKRWVPVRDARRRHGYAQAGHPRE